MAYKRKSPGPVVEGYTGASTLLANGVLVGNGTSAISALTVGTNGQLLCGATSAAPAFTTLTSSGSTISYTTGTNTLNLEVTHPGAYTFTTDSGNAVPSSGTIDIVAGVSSVNCGSSVEFTGATDVVTLNVTDSSRNTILGKSSYGGSGTDNTFVGYTVGKTGSSGSYNSFVGCGGAASVTSANYNCGLGYNALDGITTGAYNVALGYTAGINYTTSESSNILINAGGTITDSNVLRIGAGTGTSTQQINSAFISGINGVNVSSSTATVVTMTSGSDQLGTATITAGSGITVTPTANTLTITATGGVGGSGTVIQKQRYTTNSSVTATTNITFSTTLITTSNSTLLYSVTMTPTSATNILTFQYFINYQISSGAAQWCIAIFAGNTLISCQETVPDSLSTYDNTNFLYQQVAGTTSSTVYGIYVVGGNGFGSGNFVTNVNAFNNVAYNPYTYSTFTVTEELP